MNNTTLLSLITIIIAWTLGILSKKSHFISNNLIPLQNLLIGFSIACIQWLLTKDFSTAVAVSGLLAGGSYDIVNNLYKIKNSTK